MDDKHQNLIFDVGMNNGDDSAFYLAKGFDVVGVEADPAMANIATETLQDAIDAGRMKIENVAISDDPGEIEFYINHLNPKWSSAIERVGDRGNLGHTKITVPTTTIAQLIQKYGRPYYIKIDIEGFDHVALKQLGAVSKVKRPRFVSMEGGNQSEIKQMMDLGYTKFAIVNQKHIKLTRCPYPPTEGVFVDYSFPSGSSGLFGTELSEEWIDGAEAIKKRNAFAQDVNRLKEQYKDDPKLFTLRRNEMGWYDVHAVLGDKD
jgi:FkbM family methyltransferase